MGLIRNASFLAFAIVALCGYSYATGPRGTSVKTEALAASVRDNPGSYKPSYSSRTGFLTPAPRGGRGGGAVVFVPSGRSRSGGGGYRSGK
jgi:hypothetical protein